MPQTTQPTEPSQANLILRATIIIVVVLAAFGVFFARELPMFQGSEDSHTESTLAATEEKLPTLIDLGSDTCVPCKMMESVLEELTEKYQGRMNVRFINVRTDYDEAREYNIRVIPTQIFYTAEGKELFRHEGFFSTEDILRTWAEHGITFDE
jgi:thioredoxin 1